MVVMRWFNLVIFLLFIGCFFTDKIFAEEIVRDKFENKIIVYNEIGFYNKSYQSKLYKESTYETFSVFMSNTGMEYSQKSFDGYITGAGIAGTVINSGSKMNYDTLETQPSTSIVLPYIFIGNDFKNWSVDIGISYFLTFEESNSRVYYAIDGSEIKRKDADGEFNRKESYVFINGLLRIFPENWIHLKIRLGRERFSAVDSLFNAGVIFPNEKYTLELNFSFPTYIKSYMPRNNQRVGILYSYFLENYILGAYFGYLVYNHRGGGRGGISVFDYNNISIGLNFGIRW
jgi:hypothetical protein